MIVGADNGLDGGLCAISQFDGSLIDRICMPTYQQSGKREVNVREVHKWLDDLHTPFTLAIEEPLKHARSSQAMRSMAISFGKLIGMAECYGYPIARISVHDWQRAMLGKNIPKGKTKELAFLLAQRMEPDEKWLASNRSTKPHDGLIDAFLIAHHYRNNERTVKSS